MSVVSVNKMWSTKRGGVTSTDRKTYTATLSESYQVVIEVGTSFAQIMRHEEIPKVGRRFTGSQSLYCTAVTPKQSTPLLVIVDCEYQGKVGPDGTPEDDAAIAPDSPVNQPPDIERSIIVTESEVDQDFDGNAIVTANNEQVKGVRRMFADTQFSIKRNYLFFDDKLTEEYYLATNSDEFLRREPGRCLVRDFRVREIIDTERAFVYYEASVVIHVRKPYNTTNDKAWYARYRHEGLFIKVGTDIVRAVDDNKAPVTSPVLLKADGTRELVSANAVWIERKLYDAKNYADLGLLT